MLEQPAPSELELEDGIAAFVKADCPTCALVAPVLRQMAEAGVPLTVYSQDDPAFPSGLAPRDDRSLAASYRAGLTTVPTLVRLERGTEVDRVEGWSRPRWEALAGVGSLGTHLPDARPGCGSRTVEPDVAEELAVRFEGWRLASRRVQISPLEDEADACFDRGWSDGLPVVAPTEGRVLRMLEATPRQASEVVAVVPPDLAPATVEKVAINAVMSGCKPEYLPVVLAAVEAACSPPFNAHGLLATTWFSGPVLLVNGPVAAAIGMNSGVNALGQGNRANSTIGRALQLVIRNIGGGRPGGVDRATLGSPGKVGLCFAEDESGSPWEPMAVERGLDRGASAVTVFGGGGVQGLADQLSREPESLARTFAACLRSVAHPKAASAFDAMLVVGPEHGRVFRDSGWDKARLRSELDELLLLPGDELARGALGVAEGLPEWVRGHDIPKFRPGGLLIAHAGGRAGFFSAIIGGWVGGEMGSEPVTKEVRP